MSLDIPFQKLILIFVAGAVAFALPIASKGQDASQTSSATAAKDGKEDTALRPIKASAPFDISGSISGARQGYAANAISISPDDAQLGVNFGAGLYIHQDFGGPAATGGRSGLWVDTKSKAPTATGNPNRNYVGITGQGWASTHDGGSGLTAQTARGAFFGLSGTGIAESGATNLLNVTGGELNTSVRKGASVAIKTILQLVGQDNDAVAGTLEDSMLSFWDQNGASGHRTGIMIGDASGISKWPIKSDGILLQTSGNGKAASGIDLSNTVFSVNAFSSKGFSVSGAGDLTARGLTLTGQEARQSKGGPTGQTDDWTITPTGSCLAIKGTKNATDLLRICDGGTAAPAFVAAYIRTTPITLAALRRNDLAPAPGDRAFVIDAVNCIFGGIVADGGATGCPVYFDGQHWKAG